MLISNYVWYWSLFAARMTPCSLLCAVPGAKQVLQVLIQFLFCTCSKRDVICDSPFPGTAYFPLHTVWCTGNRAKGLPTPCTSMWDERLESFGDCFSSYDEIHNVDSLQSREMGSLVLLIPLCEGIACFTIKPFLNILSSIVPFYHPVSGNMHNIIFWMI